LDEYYEPGENRLPRYHRDAGSADHQDWKIGHYGWLHLKLLTFSSLDSPWWQDMAMKHLM